MLLCRAYDAKYGITEQVQDTPRSEGRNQRNQEGTYER